jgi:hypothetical protein
MDDVAEIEDYDEEPSVPTDLLELHLQLEEAEISAKEFKEVFGNEDRDEI